jgi:hypothetical protein
MIEQCSHQVDIVLASTELRRQISGGQQHHDHRLDFRRLGWARVHCGGGQPGYACAAKDGVDQKRRRRRFGACAFLGEWQSREGKRACNGATGGGGRRISDGVIAAWCKNSEAARSNIALRSSRLRCLSLLLPHLRFCISVLSCTPAAPGCL